MGLIGFIYQIAGILLFLLSAVLAWWFAKRRGWRWCGKLLSVALTLFLVELFAFWPHLPFVVSKYWKCSTEAGFEIYETVKDVDGIFCPFCLDNPMFDLGYEFLDKEGGYDQLGMYRRGRRHFDEKGYQRSDTEWLDKPTRYQIFDKTEYERFGLAKMVRTFFDADRDKIMARFTTFTFHPFSMSEGRHAWISWLPGDGMCPVTLDQSDKAKITDIFQPKLQPKLNKKDH